MHLILEEKNSEPSRTCSITLEDNTEFSVVIRKVYFPNLSPTSLFGYMIQGIFSNYLNSNSVLDQFRYVFSTVDVNDKAGGDFAWLKPSAVGYAVAVPEIHPSEKNSLFGTLCMTEGAAIPPHVQSSIDLTVLLGGSQGANAFLSISRVKFCQKILIVAARRIFQCPDDSYFAYSSDGSEIHIVAFGYKQKKKHPQTNAHVL